jgi:CheY-like chemotaxis protein
LHKLLASQLRERFGEVDNHPDSLVGFLDLVDQAYRQADEDRGLLERSIDADRQALQSRLLEAQKIEVAGRLAGAVAHEFQNLLTTISGCSELLSLAVDAGSEAQSLIEEIRTASRRGTELTQRLLASGQGQPFVESEMDLDQVVDNGDGLAQEAAMAPNGRVVLVVDDDDGVRSLTSRVLKKHGFSSLEACGGIQALEIYSQQKGRVSILVSDIVMPGMQGPELAKRLRMQSPELKVLLMSGYSECLDSLEREPDGQSTGFLQKPFSPIELVNEVERLLRDG